MDILGAHRVSAKLLLAALWLAFLMQNFICHSAVLEAVVKTYGDARIASAKEHRITRTENILMLLM